MISEWHLQSVFPLKIQIRGEAFTWKFRLNFRILPTCWECIIICKKKWDYFCPFFEIQTTGENSSFNMSTYVLIHLCQWSISKLIFCSSALLYIVTAFASKPMWHICLSTICFIYLFKHSLPLLIPVSITTQDIYHTPWVSFVPLKHIITIIIWN